MNYLFCPYLIKARGAGRFIYQNLEAGTEGDITGGPEEIIPSDENTDAVDSNARDQGAGVGGNAMRGLDSVALDPESPTTRESQDDTREQVLRQRFQENITRASQLKINFRQLLQDLEQQWEAATPEGKLAIEETGSQRLEVAIESEIQARRIVLTRNRHVLGEIIMSEVERNLEGRATNEYARESLSEYWAISNPEEATWSDIITAMNRTENIPSEQNAIERSEAGRERITDYLVSDDRLRDHYEHYRTDLMQALREFRVAAMGTPIVAHAARLYQDFEENFDDVSVRLFETVGLRENSELIERILQNTLAPGIVPTLFPHGLSAEALADPDQPLAIIINTRMGGESYESFRATFLHEFAHVYIEGLGGEIHARNNMLNEGVTEMLAEQVTSFHQEGVYTFGKTLASYLFLLDKDALMDWYTGGSSDDFEERLYLKLVPIYGDEEAETLAERIVHSGNEAFDGEIRLEQEINNFIRDNFELPPDTSVSVMFLARNYALGRLSLNGFRQACERETGMNFSSVEIFAGHAMEELRTTLYNSEMGLIESLKRAVGMRVG